MTPPGGGVDPGGVVATGRGALLCPSPAGQACAGVPGEHRRVRQPRRHHARERSASNSITRTGARGVSAIVDAPDRGLNCGEGEGGYGSTNRGSSAPCRRVARVLAVARQGTARVPAGVPAIVADRAATAAEARTDEDGLRLQSHIKAAADSQIEPTAQTLHKRRRDRQIVLEPSNMREACGRSLRSCRRAIRN